MELKLYDTLTREKRVFEPLDRNRVRMYVCGPTVYDFAHIGNARPVIVFDVLFRLLRHLYGAEHVVYVRNITDVDDKINARAAERRIDIRELTEETYRNFKQDVAALGCLPPTVEPRATDYVRRTDGKDMVSMIEQLVRSDHAYPQKEHVLFRVSSMPDYGQLSKRSLDEMLAGARVDIAPYKENPMDFVLWKPSDDRQSNYPLPRWQSPCGIAMPGRPGWHIECSAMSGAILGETFDIHGGGIDLIFPHHENEIAQSRCAFHTPYMARYWMHNGFLQVEGEKMAKSAGNFIAIRQLLENYPGGAVRLAMLLRHYRQPFNWTQERLQRACQELSQWASIINNTAAREVQQASESGRIRPDQAVLDALMDDLDTPAAITRLRALFSQAKMDSSLTTKFLSTCHFLGVLTPTTLGAFLPGAAAGATILVRYKSPIEKLKVFHVNSLIDEQNRTLELLRKYGVSVEFRNDGYPVLTPQDPSRDVERLIAVRNAARRARNFAKADSIRNELAAMGIELEDHKDGTTTWKATR